MQAFTKCRIYTDYLSVINDSILNDNLKIGEQNITLNKNQFIEKDVKVNGFGDITLKILLYKGLSKEVIGNLHLHVILKEKVNG